MSEKTRQVMVLICVLLQRVIQNVKEYEDGDRDDLVDTHADIQNLMDEELRR